MNCPACKKRGKLGVLFDETSRLAEGLGIKHVRCDLCNKRYAYKVRQVMTAHQETIIKDGLKIILGDEDGSH